MASPEPSAPTREPFPDFHDTTTFPPFFSCPIEDPSGSTPEEIDDTLPAYYLLGTIAENMTLSTNPTFVCKDSTSSSFAVTIKLPPDSAAFDIKSFRKGHTLAILGARRYGVTETKQGFINTVPKNVKTIPTSVEKLLSMSSRELAARGVEEDGGGNEDDIPCQACEKRMGVTKLSRCRGCEAVWYCDKKCQTKGWNERGHKGECKVFKALSGIFHGSK